MYGYTKLSTDELIELAARRSSFRSRVFASRTRECQPPWPGSLRFTNTDFIVLLIYRL
jgi:hypothetical protein